MSCETTPNSGLLQLLETEDDCFFPKGFSCSFSSAFPVCFETFSIGWCGACNFSATTSRNTYACYGIDLKHGTEFADPALLSAKSGHSYVLSANEPTLPDMRNVWSTVKRPALRLTVTSVAAMRSSFCFRTCGDNVLAVSDRCDSNTALLTVGPSARMPRQVHTRLAQR